MVYIRTTFYDAPHKAAQKAAQQASNAPIKDGFTRTELLYNQPSETHPPMDHQGEMDYPMEDYNKMHENSDIEEAPRT